MDIVVGTAKDLKTALKGKPASIIVENERLSGRIKKHYTKSVWNNLALTFLVAMAVIGIVAAIFLPSLARAGLTPLSGGEIGGILGFAAILACVLICFMRQIATERLIDKFQKAGYVIKEVKLEQEDKLIKGTSTRATSTFTLIQLSEVERGQSKASSEECESTSEEAPTKN